MESNCWLATSLVYTLIEIIIIPFLTKKDYRHPLHVQVIMNVVIIVEERVHPPLPFLYGQLHALLADVQFVAFAAELLIRFIAATYLAVVSVMLLLCHDSVTLRAKLYNFR